MSLTIRKKTIDDLEASHLQSRTYLSILHTKSNNLRFRDHDRQLGAAVKLVYDEGTSLHKRLDSRQATQVLGLNQALKAVLNVLEAPKSTLNITVLQRVVNEIAPGKPRAWKKILGALGVFIGAALFALSVAALPMTGGLSGFGIAAGGCLFAGSIALIHHGRQKHGVAKAADEVVEVLNQRVSALKR